ncbi:Clp protease ClpP [Fructobacillus sp. CRL 2054]|uniref:head maturation protease, ClpP-related n=1 Tax=Fructobacillus sp. CRL 2054 TaxID=2763007 RepID=UPI00237818E6|nr:head maturation protease, ClpP-related [Fructobacillus sp. CRL 2054]MDD9138318.1 Clp protease ClpP [Fructobacillus sp. CRL 2054]
MTVIDIKGPIVDDQSAMIYDWLDMTCVNPASVIEQMADNDGDDIQINIASNGGDVFAASEIYSVLRADDRNVVVNIQGLAASAASVIAMAGDTVNISPTAQIMIHQASTMAEGNQDDMAKTINALQGIDESIASAYEAKTGIDQGQLLNMMSNETWLGAKDAVDKGFADNIMFQEQQAPQLMNATAGIIPKTAVEKFINLKAKAEREKAEPATSEKTEKSKIEEVTNESRLTDLRNQKAAILLQSFN